MLCQIRDTLGFGRISGPFVNKDGSSTVKLIFSRTELQELLFPLFLHHGLFFLTSTRRTQFELAVYVFSNNITRFDMIPSFIPTSSVLCTLPLLAIDYLSLNFFRFWIVGFTIAEGSFLVKMNNDACFQLKQRIQTNLFEAIKLVFNTNRKITIEHDLYMQLSVSSKRDIQTVLDFFSTRNTLMGHKLVQYNEWILKLKASSRYNNLNF